MNSILALSGGKDSTAMALRLAELGENFTCLFTPAGNEPEELFDHVKAVIALIDRPLVMPENRSLDFWIRFHNALPSWRMRWCTRQIKILPCIEYLKANPGSTLMVGLRADEEKRKGLYGDYATYRYPLREWGWNEGDVWSYLDSRSITVPSRTNCKLCYDQQLGEWYELWRDDKASWAEGEAYEAQTGHTFRSPQRDTWPASLVQLRHRFEAGDMPRSATNQLDLFEAQVCRVCTL